MKCFSLFSGIGGFDLALLKQGHQTVGACEIDRYARAIYTRHFPNVPLWEDATKIKPQELPDFECLTAGFPCQSFSIAGARRGFEDTRGSLFFEIARIAKEKRPRYLLLENVKGLLNHDSGKTFRVIISTLDEMGYDAEWQVLNSKYFVPQNRERVFIIGHLRGASTRKIFPIGETNKEITEPRLNQLNKTFHDTGRIYHPDGIARSLRANSGGMGSKTGLYAVDNNIKIIGNKNPSGIGQSGNIYDSNGIAPTLCSSDATRGFNSSGYIAVTKDHDKLRETKDQSLAIDANYWKGPDNHGQRTMIMLANKSSNMKQRVQKRDKSWSLTANGSDYGVIENKKKIGTRIRRLTPKECERLQGFPDDYTKFGKDNEIISDTQRYRCCGNAITVPVVEFILEKLF